MEIIVIELIIGALEKTLDFMVPAHVPVQAILPGIIRLVEQTNMGITIDPVHPMLFDMERSQPLRPQETLAQAKIHYGHLLLLI